MKKNDGGPAFPVVEKLNPGSGFITGYPGLTIRDYFAGQVIGPLFAQPTATLLDTAHAAKIPLTTCAARLAYEIADAMLAERSSK